MPRITLLEQYKAYETIIDKITNDFGMSFFPDGLPEFCYDIGVNHQKHENGYYIRKTKVTDLSYFLKGKNRKPYYEKRPSKASVLRIRNISENLSYDDLDKSNIRIHMVEGNSSWASSFTDIETGKITTSRADMALLLDAKIQNYVDNYKLKGNQFACAYCRKAVDNDKKVVGTVISRQYQNFRKNFDYCSNKCASHDQMAHEG